MIHVGLDPHQDAAVCVAAEKSLRASREATNAMHGHPFDLEATILLLFEAVGALILAFPGDVDRHSLFVLSSKTFLSDGIHGLPANDRHPPPGAA